jgi:hypothetical protein
LGATNDKRLMIEQPAPTPKKRGRKPKEGSTDKNYFGPAQEEAVKLYLRGGLTYEEKSELFRTVIDPALKQLVKGIMRMPKFQKIIGISQERLEEDAYYHVIFQLEKFTPGRIGKNGQPVRAYSYYGTCVKNYILGIKIENDSSIAEHGGMLDIDEIGEQIPDESQNVEDFDEFKKGLVFQLEKSLEGKRLNKNDLIVGNTLKYMLQNWHRLEFQTKNEFVRLLCHYTQLSHPVVARSLKKYKGLVYDTLHPISQKPVRKQKK